MELEMPMYQFLQVDITCGIFIGILGVLQGENIYRNI